MERVDGTALIDAFSDIENPWIYISFPYRQLLSSILLLYSAQAMTDGKLVINVNVASDPPESFWFWPRLQVSLLELYEFIPQEPLPGIDMPLDPHLKEHGNNMSDRDPSDATGGDRCEVLPSDNDGEGLGGSQPPTPSLYRETPADQVPTSAPCARSPPADHPIQTSCQNSTPHTSPVAIQLGDHIASGRTYDVYRGRLQTRSLDATSAAANVVVKFCDPWVVGNPDITEWCTVMNQRWLRTLLMSLTS